jgi:exopolysaccharide biosynthesis polyprenyl glycosylphosphotransferase
MLGLVFRGHHRKVRVFFSASDILLIALGFLLAYITRQHLRFENNFYLESSAIALLLGWAMLVWVALGYWWEIYDRIDAAHPRVILRDAFRQCLLGTVLLVLLQYVEHTDLSRSFVGLFAGFTWFLLCLFRLNAGRLLGAMRGRFGVSHFVMVVGLGEPAQRMARLIEEAAFYGIRLTGFLADTPGPPEVAEIELGGRYPVHALDTLPDLLRKHVIDEIIFAVDSRRLAELEDVMLACDEEGVRTRVSVDFFPHVNSQVYLDRLGGSPLLTFSATPHDEIRLLVKRALDIVLAGAALLFFFLPMLFIAAIIRMTSPGPVIFRQERCGLNGRRFVCYKLRSMCENAEAMRASLEHLSERELAIKIPNDPRLTKVGRWLRKFSVDEMPQLWNVLKGDMSLVGPRPAIPEEVAQYQSWQRRRLRMRPGLTCLWAVSGRDSVDFETWMRLDMQYIDNWSLALDWKILLRTIPQVLSGRGAH